jgi:hypothetical protein
MPRELDAIVAEAVKLIDPPKDSVEAFRAQLKARIDVSRRCHQETANLPPPGKMKKRAAAYLTALRTAKKRGHAFYPPAQSGRTYPFLADLDHEIMVVETTATCLAVPLGSPQRDQAADLAVIIARDFIDPHPAIECPWRRCWAKTRGGACLTLASLIFEGITGTRGRDMMEYARQIDERQPRYVARGLAFR